MFLQSHHGTSEKEKSSVAPTSQGPAPCAGPSSRARGTTSPGSTTEMESRGHPKRLKPTSKKWLQSSLVSMMAKHPEKSLASSLRHVDCLCTGNCHCSWLPGGDKKSAVSCDAFLEYWRRVVNSCHDEASKFVYILSRGKRNYLVTDDFFPMMQDVIDSHAGLTFLKEATEFHLRYIHTVIAEYSIVLATLEEEEDINQITDYFSYEHFYVIYCKFWELDKDHDLYIDQNDLKMHAEGALSTRIIQRIFSGAVTRGPKQKEGKMSYTEFVWFLISEEDKRHPSNIEYWFRCMDLDGDGFLSMYELEYFYQEQLQRLDCLRVKTLPFNDCLCQMLDIIKPGSGKIALSDRNAK
ncbi:hypothetical protein CEXT_728041 [Caerostris extrusa]|uniref:EF-hand domain-containing protein n=1 Tax=Caerostris extrusa TaxID=172846 RepID=A0AAV4RFQ4_CAEEX|nr:hypothetical protein CEXT_728041 [Caerostris extrusa]